MIIALDFDGTCVENAYPEVGKELPYCVDLLKELVERGDQLVLWTCRSGDQLEHSVNWFKKRDIRLAGVCNNIGWYKENLHSPKIYADVYIDDKALGAKLDKNKSIDWCWVRQQLGMSAYEEMSDE